jgi:hypothetical protein
MTIRPEAAAVRDALIWYGTDPSNEPQPAEVALSELDALVTALDRAEADMHAAETERDQLRAPLEEIAVEVKLAEGLPTLTQLSTLWRIVRHHSQISRDALQRAREARL